MKRDFILGEIIRLTEANGGKPIGRSKFLDETGIGPYDYGRFWSKWGDAVREAGLMPNQFNSPLEENYVHRRLALLTRKHKHFPTYGEMRLEKITDPSFPDSKTISRRGTKTELVVALLEYCAEYAEFADVAQILAAVSAPPKPRQEKIEELKSIDSESGYVYLIRSRDVFKIGCTRAPYRRAAEIANQSAHGAELIHLILTDDPLGIEKYWHNRFGAKKVAAINKENGEWFELSAEEIRAFKRRKSFM